MMAAIAYGVLTHSAATIYFAMRILNTILLTLTETPSKIQCHSLRPKASNPYFPLSK